MLFCAANRVSAPMSNRCQWLQNQVCCVWTLKRETSRSGKVRFCLPRSWSGGRLGECSIFHVPSLIHVSSDTIQFDFVRHCDQFRVLFLDVGSTLGDITAKFVNWKWQRKNYTESRFCLKLQNSSFVHTKRPSMHKMNPSTQSRTYLFKGIFLFVLYSGSASLVRGPL